MFCMMYLMNIDIHNSFHRLVLYNPTTLNNISVLLIFQFRRKSYQSVSFMQKMLVKVRSHTQKIKWCTYSLVKCTKETNIVLLSLKHICFPWEAIWWPESCVLEFNTVDGYQSFAGDTRASRAKSVHFTPKSCFTPDTRKSAAHSSLSYLSAPAGYQSPSVCFTWRNGNFYLINSVKILWFVNNF